MTKKLFSPLAVLPVVVCAAQPSPAQESGSAQSLKVEEIVVSGSRLPTDLSMVPGSVTLLGVEDIAEQTILTNDIGQILSSKVPSLGVNSLGVISNYDVTLRGRKPAILIDGVPTTVPLRDGGRDVRSLAPSAIGSIEVIRGATAIYGLGGAGGIVNFVTKEPGEGPAEWSTNISTSMSLVHPSDSVSGSLEQAVNGRHGRLGYVFSGWIEQYSSFFDADGDRMTPNPSGQGGLAESLLYNYFGKLRYDLTDEQFVDVSINQYRTEQDTDYRYGQGVFGQVKTPALKGADPRELNQFNDNFMATARYVNTSILGSTLTLLGYYADNAVRFRFLESFANPATGSPGSQSEIYSEKRGLRLDLSTPIPWLAEGRVLWGVDVANDQTESVLTDGRRLLPMMDQTSWAPFAQLEFAATDWLKLRGGIRYEDISLDVPTFVTPLIVPSSPGGTRVEGGTLDYSSTVGNVGVVVDITDAWSAFAAYTQGFSVADIGRILIFTTSPSISTFKAEAQVIDSYEAGVRFDYDAVKGSLAYYISKSDLGSTYNTVTLEVLRSKEEVRGFEFTLDATLSDRLRVGGTYSRSDGERDSNGDGSVDLNLDTTRINPDKLTAYVEFLINEQWPLRLQALHSFEQDRFPNDPLPLFARGPIDAYTLVDLTTSVPVGPGTLTFGIQNLLNEDYFLPASLRTAENRYYVKGTGAVASIGYRVNY